MKKLLVLVLVVLLLNSVCTNKVFAFDLFSGSSTGASVGAMPSLLMSDSMYKIVKQNLNSQGILKPTEAQMSQEGVRLQNMTDEERQLEAKRYEEEREIKAKNERILSIPLPDYNNSDSFITIQFNKSSNSLLFSNKTTNFVTINTISTYYNDKIRTIKDANLELPPESTDTNGINKGALFTKEMEKSGEYIYKNLENTKSGSSKFGFAIKYTIDGKEYKYYKVNTYKNRDLII